MLRDQNKRAVDVKRDINMSKESYTRQKRRIPMLRDQNKRAVDVKRDLHMSKES